MVWESKASKNDYKKVPAAQLSTYLRGASAHNYLDTERGMFSKRIIRGSTFQQS